MVLINRVYTRKGDGGNTNLVGGQQVAKDHIRVESYGTVDELNSILGIVRAYNSLETLSNRREALEKILVTIQQSLFDLGAELATPPGKKSTGKKSTGVENPGAGDVEWLEKVIDAMNGELPPLESFVLPGGGPVSAFLHQARTVCRRGERTVVALARDEEVGKFTIPYLNRLSDALFVFSRWVCKNQDKPETLWQQGLKPDDSWKW